MNASARAGNDLIIFIFILHNYVNCSEMFACWYYSSKRRKINVKYNLDFLNTVQIIRGKQDYKKVVYRTLGPICIKLLGISFMHIIY
jgi:hypothetical protein